MSCVMQVAYYIENVVPPHGHTTQLKVDRVRNAHFLSTY